VPVDLSEGMISRARIRLAGPAGARVRFQAGDALEALAAAAPCDRVFSTWVLGYIPLAPFFAAAHRALTANGLLAFIVHRENSPKLPLEIFAELVAEDPTILRKRVAFDFPRDDQQIRTLAAAAGFAIDQLDTGAIRFRYATAQDVLDHLLKSGAGTAFYDAIDPARRDALTQRFLDRLDEHRGPDPGFEIRHDYFACVLAVRRKPE
jgi:SAM-dependent methyltransferase